MARKAYIGVNSKARRVRKIYVGISNKARRVRKGYIGVAGKARLFFSGNTSIHYYTQAPSSNVARGDMIGAGNPSYALFAGGFSFYGGNHSVDTVDAYDNHCTHSFAPDLNFEESYGSGATAGDYAVFNKSRQTLAYSTSLTKTDVAALNDYSIGSIGYLRSQGATFGDYAVFYPEAKLNDGYRYNIFTIDKNLTYAKRAEYVMPLQELRGTGAAATDDYYMLAGGSYTVQTTITNNQTGEVTYGTTAQILNDAVALDSSFTKITCADLSVSEPTSITGANSNSHIFFRFRQKNGSSTVVNAYNSSLTQSIVSGASSIPNAGIGTSLIGFAVFPGPTALRIIDDSLTITQVPFSVTKFNDQAVAVSKDKIFYGSEPAGNTDRAEDMSVHVFEAY